MLNMYPDIGHTSALVLQAAKVNYCTPQAVPSEHDEQDAKLSVSSS